MIAIVGKTCVGKTFLLEKAASLGYSTLNCDDFFAKEYQNGNKCYSLIRDNLGEIYIKDGFVDRKMIKKLISNENGRNLLEKLIYPILFDHLSKNKYDFVEIPILSSKNCDFTGFFSKILNIITNDKTRTKNIKFKNVDNYDLEFFNTINTGFYGVNTVDIYMDKLPNNMCWKSFFETHYIKII